MKFKKKSTKKVKTMSLSEIIEVLNNFNSFLLTTHINADGDGIGCLLALGSALKARGKDVKYFVPGLIPPKFSFLKGFEELNKNLENVEETEVLVILDTPTIERIEGFNFDMNKFKKIIRIDHHEGDHTLADLTYEKPNYPSATCLVYELLKEANFPIDKDIATDLYLGVLTDTGSFRFNNTQGIAFQISKELVDLGAQPYYTARMVYEMETMAHLKLLGEALLRLEVNNSLGISYITKDDFVKYNATENDSEGIVDYLRKEKNIEILLFLKELPEGGYKGSLRSKNDANVKKIAEFFGGGGHRKAAGFTANLPKEEIIKIVVETIQKEKQGENVV